MTLVEMLLAVTLFAFLLAAVAGLVSTGLRMQLTWGQAVKPYQQLERALDRLALDVESAQPLFDPVFRADSEHMEFTKVASVAGVGLEDEWKQDWLRVVYRLEEDSLIREEFLWRDADEEEPLRSETLLSLESGAFAFGVLAEDGQTLEWQPSWDGKEQGGLPRLITFQCALSVGGSQPVLQLTRAIRNPSGVLPIMKSP